MRLAVGQIRHDARVDAGVEFGAGMAVASSSLGIGLARFFFRRVKSIFGPYQAGDFIDFDRLDFLDLKVLDRPHFCDDPEERLGAHREPDFELDGHRHRPPPPRLYLTICTTWRVEWRSASAGCMRPVTGTTTL